MGIVLTERYGEALAYAQDLHRTQVRKGTTIPYLAHLMTVSAMALEMDGDEDTAIAGLLHDAAEDHGEDTLPVIEDRFGRRVRRIVEWCSDTTVRPKPPWLGRKTAYLARLRDKVADPATDPGYLRVVLADKLHNARSIRADHFVDGDDTVFDKFTGSGDSHEGRRRNTLAYYSELAAILGAATPPSPAFRWYAEELVRVVHEIGGGESYRLVPE